MTRLLVARGAKSPCGIDRALGQVTDARRLTAQGEASFVNGDAQLLPFAEGAFELVYTSWFFEHVPDPVAILKEAHRVLAAGGILWAAEVENASLTVWPRSAAIEIAWEAFNRTQISFRGDPFIGRKMYGLLRSAGFADVEVFPHTFHEHAAHPEAFAGVVDEFVGILRSARSAVVEQAELCDASTYDAAIRDLASITRVPEGTFTYLFMRCRARKT
jgi:SAM-dependent methyltransferase